MSVSRLALNVHSKMLVEFDSTMQMNNSKSEGAVDAMLCGFILEGDSQEFETLSDTSAGSADWYYNL